MKGLVTLPSWATAAMFAAFPLIGSLVTMPRKVGKDNLWYESLVKPAWTPPRWAFAPVWTALYLTMGWAAWRVTTSLDFSPAFIAYFAAHLALNYSWSRVFFEQHRLVASARIATALFGSVIGLLVIYSRIDGAAAWLTLPYAMWTALAAALSLRIRDLNAVRDPGMS